MGSNGIREFIKYFYAQIRKDGLVIDVRGNGGGNVSQMLIERLSRELLRVRYTRTYEWPGTYPNHVFHGPMVCLLNETSASDGDIFPAMFQKKELGPLIGKRSWGGVIGITSHGPLLDGGSVNVPQFGTNDRETAEWVIEGHGVDPDIVVENEPKEVLEGRDPQLERGIEEVMIRIRQDPPDLPAAAGRPGACRLIPGRPDRPTLRGPRASRSRPSSFPRSAARERLDATGTVVHRGAVVGRPWTGACPDRGAGSTLRTGSRAAPEPSRPPAPTEAGPSSSPNARSRDHEEPMRCDSR